MKSLPLVVSAAVLSSACFVDPLLHPCETAHATAPDPHRMDPWQRYELHVHACTPENLYKTDEWTIYDFEHPHPYTRHPALAWTFVDMGLDFEAIGDVGGAARAYWSAIEAAPGIVASRPEKERVQAAGFEGLGRVAAARAEPGWSSVMKLCAAMSAAYLASPRAEADESAYDDFLQGLRDAREAESAATRQMIIAGVAQGLTTVSARVSGSMSAAEADMSNARFGTKLQGAQSSIDKLHAAQVKKAGELEDGISNEVPEADAKMSFLGERFTTYAADEDDPGAYFDAVAATAKEAGWQGVTEALAKKDVQAIAAALTQIEAAVSKRERFQAPVPAPKIASAPVVQ